MMLSPRKHSTKRFQWWAFDARCPRANRSAAARLGLLRERYGEAAGGSPVLDYEAWALELPVDTTIAGHSACGAETLRPGYR